MPIPSPTDFRNKAKKHSEVREMMAQMAESAAEIDFVNQNAIFNPKSVSPITGVDLNNLNTFGFHKIYSQNTWDATLNKPKDLKGPWAFVLVLPVSSDAFFQLFYSLSDKKIAYRVRTTATVISEWVLLSGDSVVLQSAIQAANSLISDSLVQFKDDDLPFLLEDILQPKFDIASKNIFDSSKIITGKTISSNGALVDRANGVITGVLDVKNQGYITVSGLQPSIVYRAIVFKDTNNDVLYVTSIAANLTQKSFPVPAGAVTAQMTLKENADTFTLDTSTIQFEFNTTPTTYEPYRRGALNSLFGSTIKNEQAETEIGVRSRAFGASYLLFGDSITETSNVDAGLFDQTSYHKNWPTWAVDTLQMGTFRNYAKSGAAFKDRNLEPRYQYLYNQVIDAIANNEAPDVIVVACGTNDGMGKVGTYEAAMAKTTLESLDQTTTLEAARWVFWKLRVQYPDAVCFFANPLQRMSNTTEEVAPLIDGLGKIAQRHGFILIDQHRESGIIRELEVLSGAGKYLADGLHPNDLGRQRQANLIVSKIVSYMSY